MIDLYEYMFLSHNNMFHCSFLLSTLEAISLIKYLKVIGNNVRR